MKSILLKAALAFGAISAYLVLAISYASSPAGASCLAAAIALLAFAGFVLRDNTRGAVNRTFFLMSVLLAMFILLVYLLYMARFWGIDAVAPWVRVLRNGNLLLPPAMMLFALALDGFKSKALKAAVVISAACFAPFVIGNALGVYVSEYKLSGDKYVPANALGQYSIVGFLTAFWFLAFFAHSALRLISRRTGRSQRLVYLFTILGGLAAAVLGVVGFLVPYMDTEFPFPIGAALAMMPVAMGVGVLKYNLFDIKIVIRRTLPYAVLMALTGVVYAASVQVLQTIALATGGAPSGANWFLPLLLVGIGFQPVLEATQKTLDRLFFRREADLERTLAEAGEHYLLAETAEEIERALISDVRNALAIERVAFILGREKVERIVAEPDAAAPLDLLGSEMPEPVDRKRCRQAGSWRLTASESGLTGRLFDRSFVAALPLETADARGILACSEKKSHLQYADRDAMLLDALLAQAESALSRLAARAEARSARGMSDALVDSMSNAVAVMDGGGLVRRCNSAFEKSIGLSALDVLPAILERSLRGPIEFDMDDRSFVVSGRLLDESKAEYVMVATDVTELRRLQESDRRKQYLAELGQFVGSMNHEIMNILSPIDYLMAEIREAETPADTSRSLGDLSDRIKTLQGMCLELREYYTAHRMTMEEVAIREVVESALADVRAMDKERWSAPALAGLDVRIVAEPQKLKQVFVNLLKNAWESMKSRGDREPAWSVSAAAEAGRARIAIEDNGSGFMPEHLERAFTVFFSTKKARGSGLGLPIARKIVETHGGRIEIESQPGEGAVVVIDLPIEPVPQV